MLTSESLWLQTVCPLIVSMQLVRLTHWSDQRDLLQRSAQLFLSLLHCLFLPFLSSSSPLLLLCWSVLEDHTSSSCHSASKLTSCHLEHLFTIFIFTTEILLLMLNEFVIEALWSNHTNIVLKNILLTNILSTRLYMFPPHLQHTSHSSPRS